MTSSIRTNFIIYLVLLALHIGLVWWLPYFPTQDGPSHIYNLVILHDLLNGGKDWGAFFNQYFRPVPNLGFHIVAYPLISFLPPLVVEKLFVSIYIIMMGIAVPVFLRTFARPVFPFAYMVFPVVLNFTLLMGFYSYVIAIPFFLIALSCAWKFRASSQVHKFFLLNLLGFVIFYCHLIPFVFFLISLAVFTIVESHGWKKKLSELFRLWITTSPLLLIFFVYLAGGPKGIHHNLSYLASLPRFIDLTEHLFFFSMATLSRSQIMPAAIILFVFLFFLCTYCINVLKTGREMGSNAARISTSEKALLFLALVLVVIYYAAPFRLGEGSYFNQRFPWVIFVVSLPLLRIPEKVISERFASLIILFAVIPVFYFNVLTMRQESAKVAEFLRGLDTNLPIDSFVMEYKTIFPEWSDIDVLMHAASYYGISKGCVDVGNYEAGLPYFPVQFIKTLPPFPSQDQIAYDADKIRWPLYPCIRYLFGWDLDTVEIKRLGKEFHIIRQEGRLTVWQRNSVPP